MFNSKQDQESKYSSQLLAQVFLLALLTLPFVFTLGCEGKKTGGVTETLSSVVQPKSKTLFEWTYEDAKSISQKFCEKKVDCKLRSVSGGTRERCVIPLPPGATIERAKKDYANSIERMKACKGDSCCFLPIAFFCAKACFEPLSCETLHAYETQGDEFWHDPAHQDALRKVRSCMESCLGESVCKGDALDSFMKQK